MLKLLELLIGAEIRPTSRQPVRPEKEMAKPPVDLPEPGFTRSVVVDDRDKLAGKDHPEKSQTLP